MYSMMKEHINRGGYKLRDEQEKINKLWIMGHLTDEQRDELLNAAQGGANAGNEVDVVAKLAELERRVRVLEQGEQDAEPDDSTDEPPAYAPGKWYYRGDRVTYNGAAYECSAPSGRVCTWSPDEYPAYWQRIE